MDSTCFICMLLTVMTVFLDWISLLSMCIGFVYCNLFMFGVDSLERVLGVALTYLSFNETDGLC